MNCKPGDLAVIVGGFAENLGGLVRVVRADPSPPDCRHWWEVEALSTLVYAMEDDCRRIIGRHTAGDLTFIADADLRPIRDQPGEDEIITLVGKPEVVAA